VPDSDGNVWCESESSMSSNPENIPLEADKSEGRFSATSVGVIVTLDDNDPTFRDELVTFTPAPAKSLDLAKIMLPSNARQGLVFYCPP